MNDKLIDSIQSNSILPSSSVQNTVHKWSDSFCGSTFDWIHSFFYLYQLPSESVSLFECYQYHYLTDELITQFTRIESEPMNKFHSADLMRWASSFWMN